MAVSLTANYTTGIDVSVREQLSDLITVIDANQCPVSANIAQIDMQNPELYEHQIDDLPTPTAAGMLSGFDFTDAALIDGVTARTRVASRAQIQAYGIKISDRTEKTEKAGMDSEIAYQLAKLADALKRNCEKAITTNRTPVASGSASVPLVAGIPTWIRTNADYNVQTAPTLTGTPAQPVASTGVLTVRAIDESALLDLLRQSYDAGGNIDMWSVGTAVKQILSQYFFTTNARIATQYQDQGSAPGGGLQVVGAVDFYVSDFGIIAIVPNRFQDQATDIMMLDTSLWEKGVFRGYEVQEMGRGGDNERYIILHDFSLISRDEAGSAIFAEASTTAAMVP